MRGLCEQINISSKNEDGIAHIPIYNVNTDF